MPDSNESKYTHIDIIEQTNGRVAIVASPDLLRVLFHDATIGAMEDDDGDEHGRVGVFSACHHFMVDIEKRQDARMAMLFSGESEA